MDGIPLDDWRHLAEQTSKEKDPKRLVTLVQQLSNALDRERLQDNLKSESV